MRSIRRLRVAVLLAAVSDLAGTAVPPAQAQTGYAKAVFIGTATTTSPLSYPCVGPGSTTDLSKCPGIGNTGTVTTYTPTGATTSTNVPIGGNSVGFTFASTLCVGQASTVTSTGVGAGTCSISAAGSLTGSCGLSVGRGTATLTFPSMFGPPPTFTVNFAWKGANQKLRITGTVAGSTASYVTGEVEVTPVPTVNILPTTTIGNSCSFKTATVWLVRGEIELWAV